MSAETNLAAGRYFKRYQGKFYDVWKAPAGEYGVLHFQGFRNDKPVKIIGPQKGKAKFYAVGTGGMQTSRFYDCGGVTIDGGINEDGEYGIESHNITWKFEQFTGDVYLKNMDFYDLGAHIAGISAKTNRPKNEQEETVLDQYNFRIGGYANYTAEEMKKPEFNFGTFSAENIRFFGDKDNPYSTECFYIGSTKVPWHRFKQIKIHNVYIAYSGLEGLQCNHADSLEISNVTIGGAGAYDDHGEVQRNGMQVGNSNGYIKNCVVRGANEYGIYSQTRGFVFENNLIEGCEKSAIYFGNYRKYGTDEIKNDPVNIKNLYINGQESTDAFIVSADGGVPVTVDGLYTDGSNEVFRYQSWAAEKPAVVAENVERNAFEKVQIEASGNLKKGSLFEALGMGYIHPTANDSVPVIEGDEPAGDPVTNPSEPEMVDLTMRVSKEELKKAIQ